MLQEGCFIQEFNGRVCMNTTIPCWYYHCHQMEYKHFPLFLILSSTLLVGLIIEIAIVISPLAAVVEIRGQILISQMQK